MTPADCIFRCAGTVMGAMATDFRDGKTFPRRGRQKIGQAMWLLRLFDKARAGAQGTIHDYIYPCPMDRGVMDRWGVTARQFDKAITECSSDEEIHQWLIARTTPERIEAANHWLTTEKEQNLDRQDAEEGAHAPWAG
jgi:hypothetical protein